MKQILILLLTLLLTGCAAPVQPPEAMPETMAEATEETVSAAAPTLPPETEPPLPETVPVYYQTDYPYIRYGDGTIGSSGCGITCLAMAASYLTGEAWTPDMIAWEFGGCGENNLQRFRYAAEQMQLACEENFDWQITKKALQEGKIAVVLVDERSLFTESSHFILITGINEEGRYEVIDPFEPNYREDYLQEGFEKGFAEWQIVAGLEGSWVFDREAQGDFRYSFEIPQFIQTRYPGFCPVQKDMDYLACFVWAAAREESPETQQAVVELVLNRMVSDRYPDRVEDVMRQEELYTWYRQMDRAEPSIIQYQAVTNALYGSNILPMDVVHGAPWPTGGGEEWGQLGSFRFSYEPKAAAASREEMYE